MKREILSSFGGLAAVGALICTAACAVALAPGYTVIRESRGIRFLPGPPAALAIRAGYTLRNSGTTDLHFLDVRLPQKEDFGRRALRVVIDGRALSPFVLSQPDPQQPNILRIHFENNWSRKQNREIGFAYTLRAPRGASSEITIEERSFHLGLRGWAPQLQPPKHLLAPYPSRPGRSDYTIWVPADFSVLAGGARRSKKTRGAETEYRYQLRGSDLGTFVVAGQFSNWPSKLERNSAAFWTIRPLPVNPASAAKRIAEAWKTLTSTFGSLDKQIQVPHIAEFSAVPEDIASEGEPADPTNGAAAIGFPGGALVNPAAIALGMTSDRFLQIVDEALARGWFDGEVAPSAAVAIGMGDGLPEYASIVTAEARGGPPARRRLIDAYLRRYNDALKTVHELPIAATTVHSPAAQRRIALAKAPLFYVDLEDTYGEATVRAGLKHLLTTMRGQEVDYNVLRSALEESTGRDLAPIFREWLDEIGIPHDFCARYSDLKSTDPESSAN